jgi:hypothetical protein
VEIEFLPIRQQHIDTVYPSGLLAKIVPGAAKIIQPPMNADERG